MKQLTLFDLFDEAQSLQSAETAVLEKQSNLSSNITASSNPIPAYTSTNVYNCELLRQWQSIKDQYPDALLLFRVGDFYEVYKEDAEQAARILGITLTHRGNAKDFKMCGFPFHALDTYLPKLVRAGYRVAICDQLDAPTAKQLAKRNPSIYRELK